MVEAGSLEVSEDTVADALEFGHAEIRKIVAAIRELGTKVNPQEGFGHSARFRRSPLQDMIQEIWRPLARRARHRQASQARKLRLVDAVKKESSRVHSR
jgi:polyribonucleotide nucleotidyltransferase